MEVNTVDHSPIIFGTSALGNLYTDIGYEGKKKLIAEIITNFNHNEPERKVIFDSAGKYGAGLALETLGKILTDLNIPPDKIIISNKLGWKQVPLLTSEPTFEPGVWVNLKNDCVQNISYKGILECFHQGNALLGNYKATVVSVHDPDEYLDSAYNENDLIKRKNDILEAYKALFELKRNGIINSIGVGAKNISAIDLISDHFDLNWAMLACSLTIYSHSKPCLKLIKKLKDKHTSIINSAVFNSGFLTGGSYLNYKLVTKEEEKELFLWRERFFKECEGFGLNPAFVCIGFSFLFNGIHSVALNTTSTKRVKENIDFGFNAKNIPMEFWEKLNNSKIININLHDL